ncbi:hypothetical protein DICVIV_05471 [Dictyocaulus viviparus]|uniref:Uncharacterized protein n=1 Tax=Dictyocaulus viviparus TaxID=29172 RepID=A0A0D8Y1F0_DICVI|nr:hypothetical protein DICVIV_05471 [Dictyocaulus viviparus]
MTGRLRIDVGLSVLLLLTNLFSLIYAACEKEINEDVCPQREGFDKDCEQRCQHEYPHRLSSACHLRSTGTLLSFFGIKSFICKCQLPEQFCNNNNTNNDKQRRSFSLQDLTIHSTLVPLSTNAACMKPTTSSLTCNDKFDEFSCAWQRSVGEWYEAEPYSSMPFAPGESPIRRYLVGVASNGSNTLQLQTCPALCSVNSVNVTAKIWRGPWVDAQLCFKEKDTIMCAPLRISNGRPMNEISIVFTNITEGDVVLLDDISAQFEECPMVGKEQLLNRGNGVKKPQYFLKEARTAHSALGISVKKLIDPPTNTTSEIKTLKRRFCKPDECTTIIHNPSRITVLLNKMCIGRIGLLQCREKCIRNGSSRTSARCVRQRESPFNMRCLCHVRRSPVQRIDGGSHYGNVPQITNNSLTQQSLTDHTRSDVKSLSIALRNEMEITRNEVLVENNVCNRSDGDEICDKDCKINHRNSSGRCQADANQIICRCSSCVTSLCDFEKDTDCRWLDMNIIDKNFGNFSIASKLDRRNHYGLSQIPSRGRSGLFQRGPFEGPITLSLDIYPSEGINVRICVETLQKASFRCQTQTVAAKLWNRVRTKIRIKQAKLVFLLFPNESAQDQAMAIDNVWMENGECSEIN